MLAAWLADPEVYRWWGGVALDRDAVEQKYTGARRPQVESTIVETGGRPVGYLQWWLADDPGTVGLDMFLEPAARGRGLGPDAALTAVDHLLRCGTTRIMVDPLESNARAITAWAKTGFVSERLIVDTQTGLPAVLMVWQKSDGAQR
jgi:aminoglycoside 6'-N-acetyltransferase